MGYSDRRDPIGAEAIARFRVDRRDWPDRCVLAIAQFTHGTRKQRFEEVFPDGATSSPAGGAGSLDRCPRGVRASQDREASPCAMPHRGVVSQGSAERNRGRHRLE